MENNKKIKIVISINSFIVGGTQRHLTEQFKFFNFDKFEFHLIVLQQFKNQDNFYSLLPKEVKLYKLDFKGFKDFKSLIKLIKILRYIHPDIVMSSLFFSNTIFRALKIFFSYKIISREHNTYIDKTKLQIFTDRLLSLLTYKIVTVSKGVADFTAKQEKINRDKFVAISNGVDIERLNKIKAQYNRDDLKEKLNFSNEDKIIINVGRLTAQKNQKLLIDAFADFIKKTDVNYKLVILGEGGLKENFIEQIQKLKLDNKVLLLGNKENIFEYYLISEFLISTSLIEGLSNAYLEAMVFELPIVATITAGTDELIEDGYNGFFIKNNKKESVLNSLLKMSNSNLNLLGKNSRKKVENFNIVNNVRRYEDLFLEILKK